MEALAILSVFALAAALYAVGVRNAAYREFLRRRDEVAALRKELADLKHQTATLDLERAGIERERAKLRG